MPLANLKVYQVVWHDRIGTRMSWHRTQGMALKKAREVSALAIWAKPNIQFVEVPRTVMGLLDWLNEHFTRPCD